MTDIRWLTVQCCDMKLLKLHWHIWSQFGLFKEFMTLNQKAEVFDLKYSSKQMLEVVDLLNMDKREEVYKNFAPLSKYLEWNDANIDVMDRLGKMMADFAPWKELCQKWDNDEKIDWGTSTTYVVKIPFITTECDFKKICNAANTSVCYNNFGEQSHFIHLKAEKITYGGDGAELAVRIYSRLKA